MTEPKPIRVADKVSRAEREAELRKKAARQAVKVAVAAPEYAIVSCRVLPMGDSKISQGEHVAGIGEVHFEKGEVFSVREDIAKALEAKGYVEIQ